MTAFFALHNVPIEDKEEIGKWLNYHRCEVLPYPTEHGDVLGVKIPLVCIYLDYDPSQGYFCKIYDSRPEVCRKYFCKKARED